MLRKTRHALERRNRPVRASMRPQRNAAENDTTGAVLSQTATGFNEAAA